MVSSPGDNTERGLLGLKTHFNRVHREGGRTLNGCGCGELERRGGGGGGVDQANGERNGRGRANVHPSDRMAAVEEIRLAVDFWVKSLALINDSSAPKLRSQRVPLITQDPECVCACK